MRPAKDYTVQHKNINYYRPQTKLREGNVFTPVCHSVQGGVYPSMQWAKWGCVTGVCNQGGVGPGGCTTPTPTGQQAGGTHPTGMLSCFIIYTEVKAHLYCWCCVCKATI